MKKVFLALLATVLLLSSVTLVSSAAGSYTIPQCAVPPTIDGKYSSNEWYGAYHKFMNNEKGNYDYSDNPHPTPASFGVFIISLGTPPRLKYPENLTVCALDLNAIAMYPIIAFSLA